MNRSTIVSVWETHRSEGWPHVANPNEGQLMTLDTVISGCVVFFLDSTDGLDPQRLTILQDCLTELDDLTAELDADCRPYFLRLRHLGELLLETGPAS